MAVGNVLAITDQEKFYRRIIEYSVEATILHSDYKIIYINDSGARFLEGEKEELIGSVLLNVFSEEVKPIIKERIKQVIDENEPADLVEQIITKMDGTTVEVLISCHPVIYGDRVVIQTVLRDITEQKVIEKKNRELLKGIHTISTPIVPILKGISVLPLVGKIDEDRSNLLLETIPTKIIGMGLEYLIVDFSGVYNFDRVVVGCLVNLHKIAKLLGIHMIVTGIRPELALASREFGEDLVTIQTTSTVMQALQLLGVNK